MQVCEDDASLFIFVDFLAGRFSVESGFHSPSTPLDFNPDHPTCGRIAVTKQTTRNFPENVKGHFVMQRGIVTEVDFIVRHVVHEGEWPGNSVRRSSLE
jgi:hypothetical protein